MRRREILELMRLSAAGWAVLHLTGCQTGATQSRANPASGLSAPETGSGAFAWRDLLDDPSYQFRCRITQFDRSRKNLPDGMRTTVLGQDDRRWFAPGSWVKLPLALMALEHCQQLGGGLDERIVLASAPISGAWAATEPPGESLRRCLRRVFVVSDNIAANRLYEFLGQDLIHRRLAELGYPDARLVSRLGSSDATANRHSVAVALHSPQGQILWRRGELRSVVDRRFPYGPAKAGLGWQENDRVIAGGHDFSQANFLPLADMHQMLLALIAPEAVPVAQRWRLSEALRLELLTEMARWPREPGEPSFDQRAYPDNTAKFLAVDESTAGRLRLYGKCGQAYGYLNDSQYLYEPASGRGALVTASIYVNADGILNDDIYEYETIGLPFLAEFGKAALADSLGS